MLRDVLIVTLVGLLTTAVVLGTAEWWRRGWVNAAGAAMIAGIVVGLVEREQIADRVSASIAQQLLSFVLGLLLFGDAVRLHVPHRRAHLMLTSRLLVIALPLSIAVASGAACALAGMPWPVAVIVGCVVAPVDFSAVPHLLTAPALSGVRSAVTTESGLNDAVVAPVYVVALAVATRHVDGDRGLGATVAQSVASVAVAVVIGGAIGRVWAIASRMADRHAVSAPSSDRAVLLLLPLVVFAAATAAGSSGFIATFVAGLAYAPALHRGSAGTPDVTRTLNDVADVAATGTWFFFGAIAVLVAEVGIDGPAIIAGVVILLFVRAVGVVPATLFSSMTPRERLILATMHPRGVSSVVLGLLAFSQIDHPASDTVLYITTLVVIGSIAVHGAATPFLRRDGGG